MSAIYGFVGFEEEGLLEKMGRILVHRGPDGAGTVVRPGFAMGTRLLTVAGPRAEVPCLPVTNEGGELALCQDAEIYNHAELAGELARAGHVIRGRSDVEMAVHAYEEWGEACLERFNGMFAFAVHDARDGTLFLARDRFGQKPLYYWRDGARLIFASEIKAILESALVPRRPNVGQLDAYLALRAVPEPETMFEGIRTLPAAHCMTIRPGQQPVIRRYWDIRLWEGGAYRSDWEYLEEMGTLLLDAVRVTLPDDVPVGAYLSGGLDSALLVAAMRRHRERISTFCIGFDSPVDETRDAAETARFLGTDHREVRCAPADFELLPRVVWQMDRPVGDVLIIAFHKLAEAAARNLRVVISGEGPDEMYAGYSFQKLIQLVELYRRIVPGFLHDALAMPILRAAPVSLLDRFFEFPAFLGEGGKRRLVEFMARYRKRNLSENYVALKTLWALDERRAIYAPERAQAASDDWIPTVRDPGGPFLDRLLKLQYDDWLQDWGLIRQDKNAMAHSLEIRLPFLDHRLVEQAFRMPPRLKAHGLKDKIIERRLAAKMLPPTVVNRPKNPFFFPMSFFHEHPQVREWIRLTLDDAQVRRRGYFDPAKVKRLVAGMEAREFVSLKQVMSLVILELWHQIYIDRQSFW